MKRPRKNMGVLFSDSEPDDSNEPTGDANSTMQNSDHLGSNTEPSFGGASKNFNADHPCDVSNSSDDDIVDASGKSDHETPSFTSNKQNFRHRNSITWSGSGTPSPIGGSTKATKRKAVTVGISPHKRTSPLPQLSPESNLSKNDDKCQGKRQRLTRRHGQSNVNYDMKHHPMDDVLRPKYSAKRRAQGKQEASSDSDDEIHQDGANNASSELAVSPIPHCRRSSRKIHQGETPIYSAKWHPLDQMLRENAYSIGGSKRVGHSKSSRKKLGDSSVSSKDKEDFMTVNSDFRLDRDADGAIGTHETAPISPDRRRSSRVSSSKDALPNYDMKYHVMDSILPPKAAAKRLEPLRRSIHSESELDVPVAPAWSKLQNPYLDRISLEWAEIQDIDRRIYLLQRGAPLHSNTSPEDRTYDSLKKLLFDEGAITLDELSSREGTELLKARYESVRLGLQNFFGSGPEPVYKKDWILSKSEGFDVYDWKRGSMYWKHRVDSIVKGTETASSPNISGFVTQTAKRTTKNHNNGPMVSVSEDQSRSEVEMPTRMQHRKSEETDPNKSCTELLPASEVATKRTVIVDLEDGRDMDGINETEENLVESMRGEHISSSMMSDAALEELLFPVEQLLEEESYQNDTVGLVSGDSTSSGHPKKHPTQADKTCDELHSVDPEAKTFDLDTSSDRGLAERVSLGKEETTSGVKFDDRDRFDKAQMPRVEIRTRKRKSRADVAISVHEDLPGRTPLVKKIVAMNPSSPGTDIPKENLEEDGSAELSSQVEIGTPRPRQDHEAIGTPSTRRLRRIRGPRTT